MVNDCCDALKARGYSADCLHGDILQKHRERILNKFRKGDIELLKIAYAFEQATMHHLRKPN